MKFWPEWRLGWWSHQQRLWNEMSFSRQNRGWVRPLSR